MPLVFGRGTPHAGPARRMSSASRMSEEAQVSGGVTVTVTPVPVECSRRNCHGRHEASHAREEEPSPPGRVRGWGTGLARAWPGDASGRPEDRSAVRAGAGRMVAVARGRGDGAKDERGAVA